MDAVKLFSASPNAQPAKLFNPKTEASAAGKPMSFSKLLESVFIETPEMADSQQKELLNSLEQLAAALEELPAETLSAEEQEMVYALVQLLSNQTAQMEKQSGTGESVRQNLPLMTSSDEDKMAAVKMALENLKVDFAVQEKTAATDVVSKQPVMDDPEQQELLVLLQELDDKLGKLAGPAGQSAEATEATEATEAAKEATEVAADPKKFEQLFKQLAVFIRQLEKEQQVTTQQVPAQLMEAIEHVQKQLTSFTQQTEKQMPKADSFPGAAWQISTSQPASANRIPLPQGDGMPQPEPLRQQENGQTSMATAPDTAKLSQTAERPATPVPAATVRLSNLVEELGEVLRGSMRVTGTPEGTQLRVNIFPEHLGHLDIRLTAVDGKLAAQIFTSNSAAKDVLDLQVNQLRTALAQQGVTVDKIEITQQQSQQSLGQQHAQPDQRFSQQQQKQETASRDQNAYQRIEEEIIAERGQPADGLLSVDYTV